MQNKNAKKHWILLGLFWGFFMFLVMAIATPWAEGAQLEADRVAIKFVIWMVTGLAYGYIVHQFDGKRQHEKETKIEKIKADPVFPK